MGKNAAYKKAPPRTINQQQYQGSGGVYDASLYDDAFGEGLGQEIVLSVQDRLMMAAGDNDFKGRVESLVKERNDRRTALLDDRQKSMAGLAARNRTQGTATAAVTKPVIDEETLGSLLGNDERDLLGL